MSTVPTTPTLLIRPAIAQASIEQLDNRLSYGGDPDAVIAMHAGEHTTNEQGCYEVVVYREGRLEHVRRTIVEFGFEIVSPA